MADNKIKERQRINEEDREKFLIYKKLRGKLFFDMWKKSGKPATPQDERPYLAPFQVSQKAKELRKESDIGVDEFGNYLNYPTVGKVTLPEGQIVSKEEYDSVRARLVAAQTEPVTPPVEPEPPKPGVVIPPIPTETPPPGFEWMYFTEGNYWYPSPLKSPTPESTAQAGFYTGETGVSAGTLELAKSKEAADVLAKEQDRIDTEKNNLREYLVKQRDSYPMWSDEYTRLSQQLDSIMSSAPTTQSPTQTATSMGAGQWTQPPTAQATQPPVQTPVGAQQWNQSPQPMGWGEEIAQDWMQIPQTPTPSAPTIGTPTASIGTISSRRYNNTKYIRSDPLYKRWEALGKPGYRK